MAGLKLIKRVQKIACLRKTWSDIYKDGTNEISYLKCLLMTKKSTYDLQRLKGFDLLGLGGLSNRNEFVF